LKPIVGRMKLSTPSIAIQGTGEVNILYSTAAWSVSGFVISPPGALTDSRKRIEL
jgi:hypothetical protein